MKNLILKGSNSNFKLAAHGDNYIYNKIYLDNNL